ncbi:MAG: leucine--tRNA ligase, partial [Candidatus Sungiibacteriota bacterium]
MTRYDPKKIEAKWQKKWLAAKVYEPDFKRAKKPFYNLMMFPYPSAEGLHIGGMRTFTGVDIYGRMKRMQGHEVFEPIGLDAFGIHSENYALKTGRHPMKQAVILEKSFYRQLAMMGNGFAWDERLETNDPEYYRWTQWIFVQMFKRGLAYRKKAEVNWCPSCKTVLADEQVVAGQCERCGTAVIKKELEQWFFKITKYAERLLNNLEKIDWSPRVKIAQKNWIGRSEGALIKFKIRTNQYMVFARPYIEVFTTRPDTLFGATYVVLGPEHPFIEDYKLQIINHREVGEYTKQARAKKREERMAEGKEKTGVELKGVKAINPVNGEELPIWVADYVLGNVGTGAIMAVPAHDERDFAFAKKYNLPITIVICPNYPEKTCPVLIEACVGEGHLVGSGKFDGIHSEDARKKITDFVGGELTTQYRLRDWLISRQRYWGPPIPMIFCDACAAQKKGERKEMPGWYAVLEKDLPVKLPYIKNFRPTGTDQSPLASVEKFYKVRCPQCKSWARRETDVSDTFLDSAWYFLRYPSVRNKKAALDPVVTKKWLPVNSYIGGAEHSVLHLMYSRFVTMALHDARLLDFEEPFPRFRAHGLITKDGAKMSKSRGNVVNPDEYVRAYGADAVRMYLAFMAPFEQDGDFRDTGIRGTTRFLERVHKLNSKFQIP